MESIKAAFTARPRTTVAREALHPRMTFSEAFEHWLSGFEMTHSTLATNARYLADRSFEDYRGCAKALCRCFAQVKLQAIDVDSIEAYQHDRAFNEGRRWAAQAGANCIRKEISLLIRILTVAGCWTEQQGKTLRRLKPVESDVPRAMSPEEQLRFLTVASSKPAWTFIFAYSILALQTTASTKELRRLLVGDIDLAQRVIQIRAASAKRRGRIRTLPIETPECRWACEYMMWRAIHLGGGAPHHFLFPFGQRGGHAYNPTRPMSDSGMKKRWDEVRKAAALPWLRIYDLRHSAITRMAENGASIPTIMSMAGHLTVRMQQHYTTISMMAKRKAVAATWSSSVPRPSHATPAPMPPPLVMPAAAKEVCAHA